MEVDVFIWKTKKLVYFAFDEPLVSYPFFHNRIQTLIILIGKKHILFCNHEMIYSYINASMKWRNVYIFFKEKRMQQKHKTLKNIADSILGSLKEKYSHRYFYQWLSQSKSGSFYFMIRNKRGRLIYIEKSNQISNVEEIITSVYSFYLKRYESVLREYFLCAKLFKHFSNYHFHF